MRRGILMTMFAWHTTCGLWQKLWSVFVAGFKTCMAENGTESAPYTPDILLLTLPVHFDYSVEI